jgi:hypothetical protein
MRLANLTFTGLLYACLAFTSSQAVADAGVFTGNGQNLRQISSKSIQLVNIDVSIVPGEDRSCLTAPSVAWTKCGTSVSSCSEI